MVSCLMGDSTALASAIVRCCPNKNRKKRLSQNDLEKSIEAAPLFTAKLKADRLKTQKTAHEN